MPLDAVALLVFAAVEMASTGRKLWYLNCPIRCCCGVKILQDVMGVRDLAFECRNRLGREIELELED
jgi:hypothetical protein